MSTRTSTPRTAVSDTKAREELLQNLVQRDLLHQFSAQKLLAESITEVWSLGQASLRNDLGMPLDDDKIELFGFKITQNSVTREVLESVNGNCLVLRDATTDRLLSESVPNKLRRREMSPEDSSMGLLLEG